MSNTFLMFVICCSVIAFLITMVFLRPSNEKLENGTIISKNFREAGTYSQHHSGIDRGFRTPTEIAIAEAYVFGIKLDDVEKTVNFSLNTLASKKFSQGQRIKATYTERGLGIFWKKIYITEISSIN